MTTVPQYIDIIRDRQFRIAERFYGVSLEQADPVMRATLLTSTAMLSVLIKTLVDKGLITNAELNAVLTAAVNDALNNQTP